MNDTIAGWISLSMCLGCAAPDPESGAAQAISSSSPDFAAVSAQGDLVIASGATGAVRHAVSAEGRIDDIAWDPWTKRVFVVEGTEGDEGGEIASFATRSGRLGARKHVAWLDGRAKLVPSPYGAVSFEESYGERWKLLGSSPAPSLIAPVPVSAWVTHRASATFVYGFSPDEGGYVKRRAPVTAAGLGSPEVEAIPIAPLAGARLVHAPALGGDAIVGVDAASIVVRIAGKSGVGPASSVPITATDARVEAAVALEGGAVLVVLTAHPSAIQVIALDDDGAASSAAALALPGEVAEAAPFFSRDLAVSGSDRVLAATSAGVFAACVTHGVSGVQIDFAPGFDGSSLRGPIAVLPSP